MDVISQVWHRSLASQELPPLGVCLAAAAIALALIVPRRAWSLSRHAVTIVHEGSHGLVALLVGRRLSGIRLHSDTSGLTVSRGKPRGPGMMLTFLAGYPGPALSGLGAAALLGSHHAVGLLWLVVVLLALLLLQIRNWFGLWSVLVTGAIVFSVSWWAGAQWQSAFAYLLTWFLLFAALRPVFELAHQRRGGGARDSDADQLGRLSGLPGILWVAVFMLISAGALALGAYWLLAPYR